MTRVATIALAFAVTTGCSSDKGIGPSGPKEEISLAFCPFLAPAWLAIQNETEAWQAVTVNQNGLTTFEATPKVSVAMMVDFFGSNITVIFNVAREELQGTTGVACDDDELFGDEDLSGTVVGLTGSQVAYIAGGGAGAYAEPSFPDWTLDFLPTTPVDVVGLRFAMPSTQPANRVVVSRNRSPVGSTPVTLDFAGAESGALEQATVQFGNPASDLVQVGIDFVTANQTFVDLMDLTSFEGGLSFGYVSVPASLRVATDVHVINAFTPSDFGGREITHYYKAPADKTLNFGPAINAPTVSTAATTPYRRLSAAIVSQPEYPKAMHVDFEQEILGTFKGVSIVTTEAFLGGRPPIWQLVIPDMTAAGYQAEWGLSNGADTFWAITGYNGDMSVLFGGVPTDGATLTSAMERATTAVTRTAAYDARRRAAARGLRRFFTR